MNDGIIKNNGTSRLIKSIANFKEKYQTYEDFAAAIASGTLPIDILFNKDGWTQQPDFLNKSTLLKDATAALFGFGKDAVPDDIFVALAIGLDKYGFGVYVSLPDGSPVSGAVIEGLDESGKLTTDESGYALGISTSSSVTFSVKSPLIDVESIDSKSVQSSGTITPVKITLPFQEKEVEITSSMAYKHSNRVTEMDFSAVGGGGGGGGPGMESGKWGDWVGGGGGGGGFVSNKYGVTPGDDHCITVQIGAGGYGASTDSNGGTGGTTKVEIGGSVIVSANGGGGGYTGKVVASYNQGGSGNGNGGAGHNITPIGGAAGTGRIFDDPSKPAGGGGGGGLGGQNTDGATITKAGTAGGSPSGGSGCGYGIKNNPKPGSVPGGGGGGGGFNRNNSAYGAKSGGYGGSGALYVIFHH